MVFNDTRYFVDTTPPFLPEAPKPTSCASRTTGFNPRSIALIAADNPVYPPPMMTTSAAISASSVLQSRGGVAVSRHNDLGGEFSHLKTLSLLTSYCLSPSTASASSLKVEKWKSGFVTTLGTGVPPKPSRPCRRSIQQTLYPSSLATPIS